MEYSMGNLQQDGKMLKSVKLTNVGVLPNASIRLGERLSVLTGDNGLGKSFFLDVAWYALTRRWPAEVNGHLTSGYMARPLKASLPASIDYVVESNARRDLSCKVTFSRETQTWLGKAGRPLNPGLVVYAHYDGSFSVYDPARNYWSARDEANGQKRPSAFVFTPAEVWQGINNMEKENGSPQWLCNGLIRDWVDWQRTPDCLAFNVLNRVLSFLSPPEFKLVSGEPTRISLFDSRNIPTLRMPYGETPVLWCSAGMRRMLALAYLLAWTVNEHLANSKLLGQPPAKRLTFLFDEAEAHLHPRWQRTIIGGALAALTEIQQTVTGHSKSSGIQMVAVTHSPLVMGALEDSFDEKTDKWLDFDATDKGNVKITSRHFERHGDSDNWLKSEAFDLPSTYSPLAEQALQTATKAMKDGTSESLRDAYVELLKHLAPTDGFLFRFRALCENKGISLR